MERVMFLGGVHEQQNNCLSSFYLRKGKEKEEAIIRTNKDGNKN